MSESLESTIASEVAKASSLTSDAGSVTRRSIDDLIKADRYLASKRASSISGGTFGIRFMQIQQPEAG